MDLGRKLDVKEEENQNQNPVHILRIRKTKTLQKK